MLLKGELQLLFFIAVICFVRPCEGSLLLAVVGKEKESHLGFPSCTAFQLGGGTTKNNFLLSFFLSLAPLSRLNI